MDSAENLKTVLEYLPAAVRAALQKLEPARLSGLQEIRLRAGRPVALTMPGCTELLARDGLTRNPAAALIPSPEDLSHSLQAVLSYSVYSHQHDLAQGYVTIRGGNRVGICGSAVRQGEDVQTVRGVSGMNFRIAGEVRGAASSVFRQLGECGGVLIAGKPGSGKTTFLRDYCRLLGDRYRTALVDERGELAAVYRGVPQHDVGLMTDVLDGYPRGQGIRTALRVLTPEHILCDELSSPEDMASVLDANGSGVQLTASVHAGSFEELRERACLWEVLQAGVFRHCVMLGGVGQVQAVRRIG